MSECVKERPRATAQTRSPDVEAVLFGDDAAPSPSPPPAAVAEEAPAVDLFDALLAGHAEEKSAAVAVATVDKSGDAEEKDEEKAAQELVERVATASEQQACVRFTRKRMSVLFNTPTQTPTQTHMFTTLCV